MRAGGRFLKQRGVNKSEEWYVASAPIAHEKAGRALRQAIYKKLKRDSSRTQKQASPLHSPHRPAAAAAGIPHDDDDDDAPCPFVTDQFDHDTEAATRFELSQVQEPGPCTTNDSFDWETTVYSVLDSFVEDEEVECPVRCLHQLFPKEHLLHQY